MCNCNLKVSKEMLACIINRMVGGDQFLERGRGGNSFVLYECSVCFIWLIKTRVFQVKFILIF